MQLAAVAFDQTSGHDQAAGLADALVFGSFENGIDRLLFGRFDEAAGVDNECLGFVWILSQLMAASLEQSHHDLAVH